MKSRKLWFLLILTCVTSVIVNYRSSHMDRILATKAERAFKNNNIELAQHYLEQAFVFGLKDKDSRVLYVNSIINSPFTPEAQEKLIKFIEYPKEDIAKFNAENFLNDFRQEISNNYPETYILNATFNGKIMRWSEFPITYGFVNKTIAPDYFITEIENAFSTWENATKHQLRFSQSNTTPNIIIEFDNENPAKTDSTKYVTAYTTPELNVNLLKNMTIKFYLKDPKNEFYTKNQVYNTALHEIVHALGLMGHSNDNEHVMHSIKDYKLIINDARDELTPADINTVKLLYKIKPEITNTANPKGEYAPLLVLKSSENIQRTKMNEAISYVQKAPKLAGGYIDLAEGYLTNKDYENAEKALKKALKLTDSEDITGLVYYNLGVVYYYSDKYEKAERYLQESLKFNDIKDSHYLLAEIYSQTGQFKNSIKEYENLLKQDPQNIDYVIGLTNIYVKKRDFLKARNILKTYIKLNPKDKNNKRLETYGILKIFL